MLVFSEFFDKNGSCKEEDWPRNFMQKHGEPDIVLSKAMNQYASENLAMVHVFIQSPFFYRKTFLARVELADFSSFAI